ncbi:MAG: tRNA (guanine-N7-)-methyltransferase [Pseudonocardiales bacterium]|nr:tRNA (guanine-N7-)-methyltransferase [Pseudonocardiales bacterium]
MQTIYPQRARMTTGQQRAWDRNWGRWGADVADLPDGPLDAAGWFGRAAPVVLEIGSGMGESTAVMAMAAPDVDHLAVEIYQPGLAQLLLRIEQAEIGNLRLLRGDAYTFLHEHVAAGSLHAVRIYFPDPWPKRRHHKRRLVRPELVALVTSRLAVGATLHLATDWEPYAQEMLAACVTEPGLRNTAPHGFATRPAWRPVTKFEQRARDEGRVVRDLLFARL